MQRLVPIFFMMILPHSAGPSMTLKCEPGFKWVVEELDPRTYKLQLVPTSAPMHTADEASDTVDSERQKKLCADVLIDYILNAHLCYLGLFVTEKMKKEAFQLVSENWELASNGKTTKALEKKITKPLENKLIKMGIIAATACKLNLDPENLAPQHETLITRFVDAHMHLLKHHKKDYEAIPGFNTLKQEIQRLNHQPE